MVISKGKKFAEHKIDGDPADEVVDAMLGPTGNLRAPAIVTGRTVLVGFHEEPYGKVFG